MPKTMGAYEEPPHGFTPSRQPSMHHAPTTARLSEDVRVEERLTVQEAYQHALQRLTASRTEYAATVARQLIQGLLSLDGSAFARFYTEERRLLPRWQLSYALKQLEDGMPLPYVLGEADFMGFTLKVAPGVLIPRLETEGLVEGILQRVRKDEIVALDIGTGSGAIALALALKRTTWQVRAIEKSSVAAHYAKTNLRAYGLLHRVHVMVGDALTILSKKPSGDETSETNGGNFFHASTLFHVIAANPPYIDRASLPFLPRSVQKEPRLALDGGERGLYMYQKLIPLLHHWLTPDGLVAFEIGYDQGDSVPQLLRSQGYQDVQLEYDLFGKPRYVFARRTA
ncbi:MAG: peptide chain release factor N(5)-glutamine methyltransferase [Candidatus Carbobacillus sp.]|nr:peptide chain release factor N(5)-glutamine methyltransferase [Candidatus Carbobacillus sp.]